MCARRLRLVHVPSPVARRPSPMRDDTVWSLASVVVVVCKSRGGGGKGEGSRDRQQNKIQTLNTHSKLSEVKQLAPPQNVSGNKRKRQRTPRCCRERSSSWWCSPTYIADAPATRSRRGQDAVKTRERERERERERSGLLPARSSGRLPTTATVPMMM